VALVGRTRQEIPKFAFPRGFGEPQRVGSDRRKIGRYGERKEISMRGKLMFGAGIGLGYVLGTRAGRERYDQIRGKAKQTWESKTVQDAAGALQDQAGRLYEGGKQMMSEQTHTM
jgi:hypothetical protein